MKDINYCCVVYDKYKNLKLAAEELDIKWQTLYSALVKLKHPVTGDKAMYGSLQINLQEKLRIHLKN